MIDIHSHILPNIDDGAKSIEVSLEMAGLYVENGYRGVIATPHWIEYGGTVKRDQMMEVLDSFRKKLEEERIDLRIYPGNEFYISPRLPQYIEENQGATLNDTDYVLVEFPMREYPSYIEEILFHLQLKGYKPIIAHPERYLFYQEDPNRLRKLVLRGVYTQMNFPSITGQYGREVQRTAMKFLDCNLIHMVATDSHSNDRRSPNIKGGADLLRQVVGEEEYRAMTLTRPERIIANEVFEVEMPLKYEKKKWFQFWKK